MSARSSSSPSSLSEEKKEVEKPVRKPRVKQPLVFVKKAIPAEDARKLFTKLRDTITWTDGIRSRSGFTRKAKSIDIEEYPDIYDVVLSSVLKIAEEDELLSGILMVGGAYLNYYVNGDMYTPTHNHKDTLQLVISLGATRQLRVNSKSYDMENGDIILFGSQMHGVPKQPEISEGRISIAVFIKLL